MRPGKRTTIRYMLLIDLFGIALITAAVSQAASGDGTSRLHAEGKPAQPLLPPERTRAPKSSNIGGNQLVQAAADRR
jgi:hypothetical protein